MADIFISYAREDQEVAQHLAAALEAQGWSVFWDRTIPAGETWRSYTGKALEGAQCVIVAWSAASVESNWVHEEAEEAKARDVLVPVFIESIAPPFGFRSIQAANLVGWDGEASSELFVNFRDDVSRFLGVPPTPVEEQERQPVGAESRAEKEKKRQRAEATKASASTPASAPQEDTRVSTPPEPHTSESTTHEQDDKSDSSSASRRGLLATVVAGIGVVAILIAWINREPSTYELTVRPIPAGAAIEIVGEGTYRAGMQLAPGTYTLRASLTDHRSEQVSFTITDADKIIPVQLEPLEIAQIAPTMYGLTITTTPPGAAIEVVGESSYRSGMQLEPGSYTVRASLDGYSPEEVAVVIDDADMTIPLKLESVEIVPATHALTVTAAPPGATIEVVGVGRYVQGMQLAPGNYSVRGSMAGYHTKDLEITILDRNLTVPIRLDPLPPLPELVEIPAGTFMMGSEQGSDNEKPVHEVRIAAPFHLSATEITFEQYDAFTDATGRTPARDDKNWGRGNRPVINVNWNDAQAYARWLGEVTDNECRLPSEAEWEYSARSRTPTEYGLPAPNGSNDIAGKALANCGDCGGEWAGNSTSPVASFAPNDWDLYDMHGNVFEWVEDCLHGNLLLQFARFADRSKHRGPLTADLALQWAACRNPPRGDIAQSDFQLYGDSPATWPVKTG